MLKKISRRKFIQQITVGSLTTPVLASILIENLSAKSNVTKQPLIWMQGHSSSIHKITEWSFPEYTDFISTHLNVIPIDNLDAISVEIDRPNGYLDPILILDGYFPKNEERHILKALEDLIIKSRAIILFGNEASYSSSAPQGFVDLEVDYLNLYEKVYLKLPGVPTPARYLLAILNYVILHQTSRFASLEK